MAASRKTRPPRNSRVARLRIRVHPLLVGRPGGPGQAGAVPARVSGRSDRHRPRPRSWPRQVPAATRTSRPPSETADAAAMAASRFSSSSTASAAPSVRATTMTATPIMFHPLFAPQRDTAAVECPRQCGRADRVGQQDEQADDQQFRPPVRVCRIRHPAAVRASRVSPLWLRPGSGCTHRGMRTRPSAPRRQNRAPMIRKMSDSNFMVCFLDRPRQATTPTKASAQIQEQRHVQVKCGIENRPGPRCAGGYHRKGVGGNDPVGARGRSTGAASPGRKRRREAPGQWSPHS